MKPPLHTCYIHTFAEVSHKLFLCVANRFTAVVEAVQLPIHARVYRYVCTLE